jgi:DNA-binding Xre family transcriptional regulator
MKYNGLRKFNSDNSRNDTHKKIFEIRIKSSKFKKMFKYLYENDISLKELSSRSGVALSKLSEMRRGADCTTSTLNKIREGLGVNISEII